MIIYEVNLSISHDIYDAYYAWLLDHIAQMLKFDGFKSAEIVEVATDTTDEEKRLRVNYIINSSDALENYLTMYAPMMRADAIAKFGNKFSAQRRVVPCMSCD